MDLTKKCIVCQRDIPLMAKKCPECHSDLRSWHSRHPFLATILGIAIIGMFMSIMFASLNSTIEKGESMNGTAHADPISLSKELETQLKHFSTGNNNLVIDEKTTDTVLKIEATAVTINMNADLVKRGELSSNPKDVEMAKKLKVYVVAQQTKAFPQLRKVYAKIAGDKLWESDIETSVSGKGNTTFNLIGSVFVANKNISDFHAETKSMYELLRFKTVNYKWSESADYTTVTINSKNDADLVPMTLQDLVKSR